MSLYTLKKVTGSAALSAQLYNGTEFKFIELRLHLNTPGTGGTFEIQKDSASGPEYDLILMSQPMNGIKDIYLCPPGGFKVNSGDVFVITWSNPGSATYGLEVQTQ